MKIVFGSKRPQTCSIVDLLTHTCLGLPYNARTVHAVPSVHQHDRGACGHPDGGDLERRPVWTTAHDGNVGIRRIHVHLHVPRRTVGYRFLPHGRSVSKTGETWRQRGPGITRGTSRIVRARGGLFYKPKAVFWSLNKFPYLDCFMV